ncbi:MAG TPA: YwiC-like family protein [Verrucomicrobiae bacterium]|nr:YwiC-like family protein [Verrucomicrobiae bacterium]
MKPNTRTQQSLATQMLKLIQPKEHGSWSLVLEPLAFGLLVAPSPGGVSLAFASLAAFLCRRPLKMVLRARFNAPPQLSYACVWMLGSLAAGGLSLALYYSRAKDLWALAPSALAGLVFLWFDSRNSAREELAELCGAITFGMMPFALSILAGHGLWESLAISAIMLSRSIPTVMFIRTCVRRNKGRMVHTAPALAVSSACVLLTSGLVALRLAPGLAVLFALLLAARVFCLLIGNWRLAAKTTGIMEAAIGAATMPCLAFVWKLV